MSNKIHLTPPTLVEVDVGKELPEEVVPILIVVKVPNLVVLPDLHDQVQEIENK